MSVSLLTIWMKCWRGVMNKLRSPSVARWFDHTNAVHCDELMRIWLSNRDSLTARLQAQCEVFRVQRLFQGRAMVLADEYRALNLARTEIVTAREVLLRCDERPVVYAHTVLPLSANASQWPLFASLGNRSLGTTLFSDPLVERGELQYARLRASHPLMQQVRQLGLVEAGGTCYARRSLFRRKSSCLLVTEVFLPQLRDVLRSHLIE